MPSKSVVAGLLLVGTCWLGAYASTWRLLVATWLAEPDYSHGFLVPAFSGYLIWHQRKRFRDVTCRADWRGIVLLLISIGLRIVAAVLYLPWLEMLSLLVSVAGVCWLIGGSRLLRLSLPALGFCLFMIPLPARVQSVCSGGLQRVATLGSCYLLQTCGQTAMAEGNVILFGDYELEVAEACSGLRMMLGFVALTTGAALLSRLSFGERTFVVASSIPIAVMTNIVRITATGLGVGVLTSESARKILHDVAAYSMMPLGFGLVFLELFLLSRLFDDSDFRGPMPLVRVSAVGGMRS